MIGAGAELRIGTRHLNALLLHKCRRPMPHARNGFFLLRWPSLDAALAAVIAHVNVVIHDHRPIDVNIPNDRRVHVHHGGVEVEVVVLPPATTEAVAEIAVAVVDCAI